MQGMQIADLRRERYLIGLLILHFFSLSIGRRVRMGCRAGGSQSMVGRRARRWCMPAPQCACHQAVFQVLLMSALSTA